MKFKIGNFFKSDSSGKFGTVQGVLIPNILQMIGVILFMRLGWVLGHVGIFQMASIISLSACILFLTGLSLTAIVSNMRVRGGGAYYLISRALGVEFGSAIGVLLCVSSLCSTALCTTGFSLSLHEFFPHWPLPILKIATLSTLVAISYISTNFALKTQMFIFASLTVAIGAIFLGSGEPHHLPTPIPTQNLSFWVAFSLFFPAMTGIESGMAMSGDLKNPSRSLPIGTLLSIAIVYTLYLSTTIFLSRHVEPELLRAHPFILYYMSKVGFLIVIGIWAATLSSALGAILGGPRVMQAVAKDGVLPKILARGFGATNQPRVATLVVFACGMFLALAMEINQIIPMMTMACLVSYGLLNFIAFFQSFIRNPSWRPTIQIPFVLPLIGSLGCFMAMFMINAGATFIVLALVVILCLWTSKRKVRGNWDDIRHSLFSFFVQKGMIQLSRLGTNAKGWRPQILALFDSPMVNKNLAFFSHGLNQERAFLTFGTTVPFGQDVKASHNHLKEILKGLSIPSYIHINPSVDPESGADQIIRNYGFGLLKPNTILFSIPQKYDTDRFIRLILDTHFQEKNLILLKDDPAKSYLYMDRAKKNKQINLWWRGKYPGNFELCLALAYLLQQSPLWPQSKICIKMIGKEEEFQEGLFEKYKEKLRMKNLSFAPIIDSRSLFFENLLQNSQDADLTFLGLRRPTKQTSVIEYQDYYLKLMESTKDLKNIAYVLSGEPVKFRKIFL